MERRQTLNLEDDHAGCRVRVKKISEVLGSAVHGIEDKFLKTGEKLMEIHSAVAALSEVVESARDILGNNEYGALTEYIRIQTLVLDQLHSLSALVRKGLQEINRKDVQINNFQDTCSFINNASKNLSIIALNIKVQSGHLEEREDAFFSFGKEIKTLAVELLEVSNLINIDCLETQSVQKEQVKIIESDLLRFEEFINNASFEWERIESKMMMEIKELVPGFESAQQCLQKISEEISQLVIALQSHDIVRQKVEHVCETLDEIAEGKKNPGKDVLTLQANKLDLSLKEIVKVRVIGVSAFSVIHKMLSDLTCFISNDKEEVFSLGMILDDSLNSLMLLIGYLDKGDTICTQITTSIDDALFRVRLLEQYAEKTKEINESLEIKAINAIVMTVGLKKRSKPFRVLGKHVNELSRKSINFAKNIRKIIESIVEDRGELDSKCIIQGRENVHQEVEALQAKYSSLQQQIKQSGEGAHDLKNMILQSGDALIFLNTLIEVIQKQIEELKKMYCEDDVEDFVSDGSEIERYTMESERDTYRKVYGKGVDKQRREESASITLF